MNRTQDEVLARMEAVAEDDFFGFRREVLVQALDYEHAKPFLKEGTTEADWPASDFAAEAAGYLAFAIGKIVDHRGISAERSVGKLAEFAWLLGRDDVVAAMEAAPYAQYGAPKVRVFADAMGLPWPGAEHEADAAELARMVQGLPCEPGCASGCGQ